MKQYFLLTFGMIMVLIGGIGLFLPILPTTPFILVAAGCFSGHPRLKKWLYKSRFFGDYIRSYQKGTVLKKSTAITGILYLWIMLIISMYLIDKLFITITMVLIGCAVTCHILYMANPRRKH